jgi:aspartate racemase
VFLACNTSHAFLDEVGALAPEAAGYVVDMVRLLAGDAARRGVRRAYLLASEGTIASGVYQDRFGAAGVEVVPADEAGQARLRGFIEAVKQNRGLEDAKAGFAGFVRGLGEPCVILGCTELPLLVEGEMEGVTLLDPMQAAIDYVVDLCRKRTPNA